MWCIICTQWCDFSYVVNIIMYSGFIINVHLKLLLWFLIYFFFHFVDLHRLSELQEFPIDLEPYVKKLMNSRRRVMLVNNILQNAQVLT